MHYISENSFTYNPSPLRLRHIVRGASPDGVGWRLMIFLMKACSLPCCKLLTSCGGDIPFSDCLPVPLFSYLCLKSSECQVLLALLSIPSVETSFIFPYVQNKASLVFICILFIPYIKLPFPYV